MHGIKNKKLTIDILPTVNQTVRSYQLLPETNECIVQQGYITRYTDNTDRPYRVAKSYDHDDQHEVSHELLHGRLTKRLHCTQQELSLKGEVIFKVFHSEALTDQQNTKHTRQKQECCVNKSRKASRHEPFKLYQGAIQDVWRERKTTYAQIIYNDQDLETVAIQQLLSDVAFKRDPHIRRRKEKLLQLYTQRMTGHRRSATKRSARMKLVRDKQHLPRKPSRYTVKTASTPCIDHRNILVTNADSNHKIITQQSTFGRPKNGHTPARLGWFSPGVFPIGGGRTKLPANTAAGGQNRPAESKP